jgi:predicted amidohydrolase
MLRAGYIQLTPAFGRLQHNREAACRMVAATEAQLLVLPELCLSGYQFRDRREARSLAEPADGPTAAALAPLCRQGGKHVVLGLAERDGERLYNSAILVGPEGLLGVYRKTHLFWDEPDWCEPGDSGFVVWDLGGYKLGLMICFDWVYPEAARSLALAGAEVIAHPSDLVLPHCQQVMPARALENRVFTITANRYGTEDRSGAPVTFSGRSQIASPAGEVLAEAPATGDHTAVVELDLSLARDKHLTPRNHLLEGRRPELYRT